MARGLGKLTALAVSRAKEPGMYPDGAGLYLQVGKGQARSWIFRYSRAGKPREMGLGSLQALGLAQARDRARECRELLAHDQDPIESRNSGRAEARLAEARAVTFKQAAERHMTAKAAGWRNPKHRAQWGSTLETYAYPHLGHLSVQAIDTPLVLKALDPIWRTKPETASRLRGRIEAVLDACTARGERKGENPARWKGNLAELLPRLSRKRVKHHPALPYGELGAFVAELRKQDGVAALALEFLILTAARTSEVTGAVWSEIDVGAATWTIPADRIKGGQIHRVPLSAPAVAVLKRAMKLRADHNDGSYVFPGGRRGKSLSENGLLALLARMERDDITAHGFRSTFRDWAAETTNYPRELAEKALAHVVADETERAYQRGDLFEKRRRLMAEWAKYCGQSRGGGQVIAIRGRS